MERTVASDVCVTRGSLFFFGELQCRCTLSEVFVVTLFGGINELSLWNCVRTLQWMSGGNELDCRRF